MHPPIHCPRRSCPNFSTPPPNWFIRYGTYSTAAHGTVQRYQCRRCHTTVSDQSRSLHFFAKRRLPLQAIWLSLLEGSSQRGIARRYHTTASTIQTAMLRLGRQAMAAQLQLLTAIKPQANVVYDGLRSCVSSQDYPCDITTVVEPVGETILTMSHSVMVRGGRMRAAQRRRLERKLRLWRPERGRMRGDIARIYREIWGYLRAPEGRAAVIDTDEHPLYRSRLAADAIARHLQAAGALVHRRTAGSAPRTMDNRLFAVNYIDRLLRHRLKEHTRESIAIARSATMQMHRAWIFAVDHNCLREYRVKRPELGRHAEQGAVDPQVVRRIARELFSERIEVRGAEVPETISMVWTGQLPSPPVRWKVGQKRQRIRIPRYALEDLASAYQHAA